MEARDDKARPAPLVIAVGGGKGGVGKSVVAANLAVALAKQGAHVIAVDADLGSANLHTLFGIDHTGLTIQALIDGRVSGLEELALDTRVPHLRVVPGSVALPGAANLQHARKLKLLRHIAKLDADVVIVDCGAGVHFNVIDFFAAADAHLLVASGQLVSLQNAYGFLKASLYRLLRQRAAEAGKAAVLDQASSEQSELETVAQLLARVAQADPALALDLQNTLATTRISLLGNQLTDLRELNALHALSRMIRDFLALDAPVVGGLLRTDRIHASVTRRKPFLLEGMADAESKLFMRLADEYLEIRRVQTRSSPEATADDRPFGQAASSSAVPLPAPLSQYHRAHERYDVSWAANVEVSGVRQVARVHDVSAGGMKIELTRPCAAGTLLRLRLADRPLLSVRAVHVVGFMIGCRFDPAPAGAALAGLLQHARAEPPKNRAASPEPTH